MLQSEVGGNQGERALPIRLCKALPSSPHSYPLASNLLFRHLLFPASCDSPTPPPPNRLLWRPHRRSPALATARKPEPTPPSPAPPSHPRRCPCCRSRPQRPRLARIEEAHVLPLEPPSCLRRRHDAPATSPTQPASSTTTAGGAVATRCPAHTPPPPVVWQPPTGILLDPAAIDALPNPKPRSPNPNPKP